MQQKPKMDFEDGFFVTHDFVFGNKNPPGIQNHATKNPRWILKMGFCLLHIILHLATKSPSSKTHLGYKIMDFEVRVFVAHNFVFDTFEDGFLLFL
jgi:hypothetical protein